MQKVLGAAALALVTAFATPSFAQMGARAKVAFAADRLMGIYISVVRRVTRRSASVARQPFTRTNFRGSGSISSSSII